MNNRSQVLWLCGYHSLTLSNIRKEFLTELVVIGLFLSSRHRLVIIINSWGSEVSSFLTLRMGVLLLIKGLKLVWDPLLFSWKPNSSLGVLAVVTNRASRIFRNWRYHISHLSVVKAVRLIHSIYSRLTYKRTILVAVAVINSGFHFSTVNN